MQIAVVAEVAPTRERRSGGRWGGYGRLLSGVGGAWSGCSDFPNRLYSPRDGQSRTVGNDQIMESLDGYLNSFHSFECGDRLGN